jgi:hypothetical protein
MKVFSSILVIYFVFFKVNVWAETWPKDTVVLANDTLSVVADTLKKEGHMNGFTRFVYDRITSDDSDSSQRQKAKDNDLARMKGKRIRSIKIKQLDIFGPTFEDTSRVTHVGIEKFANKVHTRTSERIIQKNILFKVGDKLEVDKVYDNERIIRLLPFIKDVCFMVDQDSLDSSMVDLTVVTKDVFAFGLRARFRSIDSGELEMYNQNIWGAGHQISAAAVTSVNEEPNIGFEGFYSVNNIRGHFVNLTLGYADTYWREGLLFNAEKQFLRTNTRWGGGMTFYRLFRSDRFYENTAIEVDSLDYRSFDTWSGYSFKLNNDPSGGLRLILAGRYRNLHFYERPDPGDDNNQYFGNSNFYIGSVSLSKRSYIRDHHILGYGITEDIPKGFLHEFVLGFDQNENTDRWYSHLYLSTGNLIVYKPSYMFISAGIGSFFNARRAEQGQFELNWNYISRQFLLGAQTARQFLKLRYVYGFKRFDQEALSLKNQYGIRGFYSDVPQGQQRLLLSAETVIFQRKSILSFNFAFFGFTDLGIIGSSHKIVFNGDYYTGIGGGIRLRNENLIFRTIQLRLAFYPGHPGDSGALGFSLREIGGTNFYSFQPRKPEPLQFK